MNFEDEHSAPKAENASSTESVSPRKPATFFQERPPQVMEAAPNLLRHWTRRDLLLFGAAAIAAVAGGGSLLPQTTLKRLGILHENNNWPKKEWLLNRSESNHRSISVPGEIPTHTSSRSICRRRVIRRPCSRRT